MVPKTMKTKRANAREVLRLDRLGLCVGLGIAILVALAGCDGLTLSFMSGSGDPGGPGGGGGDSRAESADLVRLEVLPVGYGQVSLVPPGAPDNEGLNYDRGTTVTLQADADPGWAFTGYYTAGGTLLSHDPVLDLVLGDDYSIVAEFTELAPPPPPPYLEETVVGADGQFLGVINEDPFDPDSLANPFGQYGDRYSAISIWNPFGIYGGAPSDLSAYDPGAEEPPGMYLNGVFESYLTRNPAFSPRVDPDDVAEAIGRFDVISN